MDLDSFPRNASSSSSWPWGGLNQTTASSGYITGPSSSTGSPFIDPAAEPVNNLGPASSSSSTLLHPDLINMGSSSYAPSTSSTPLSRRSSSHALNSPCVPSPSPSPQPEGSAKDKGKKVDGEEIRRVDADHALDCARILLAPVLKRQRERTELAVAERARGIKRKNSMPINIPLHGPRVEIILAWLGAVHLPELD